MAIKLVHGIPYDDEKKLYLCSDKYMLTEDRETAKRIHSINFTVEDIVPDTSSGIKKSLNFNSYGDFHLIPSKRPVIAPPSINSMYVDVPGSEIGEIDMSEALTGDMTYKNREGTLDFYYENTVRFASYNHSMESYLSSNSKISGTTLATKTENSTTCVCGFKPWYEIYDALMNYMHGRRIRLTLLDEPEKDRYYYYGRIWVSSFESGQDSFGTVQLSYKLEPYRYLTTDGMTIKKI